VISSRLDVPGSFFGCDGVIAVLQPGQRTTGGSPVFPCVVQMSLNKAIPVHDATSLHGEITAMSAMGFRSAGGGADGSELARLPVSRPRQRALFDYLMARFTAFTVLPRF
jgi:hypothetical protein